MRGITKNDLAEWLGNPVTRAYQAGIKSKVEELQKSVASGQFLNMSNPYETAANIARVIGHIDGLKDALEIDNDTVLGEDE
jgi:hypothetical protein